MTQIKLIHVLATLAFVFTTACTKSENKQPKSAPQKDLSGEITLGTDSGAKSASASGAATSAALGGATSGSALGLGRPTSGSTTVAVGGSTSAAGQPTSAASTTKGKPNTPVASGSATSSAVGSATSGAIGASTSSATTSGAAAAKGKPTSTPAADNKPANDQNAKKDQVEVTVPEKTIKEIKDWRISAIKVLDERLLTVVNTKDLRILFENYLTLVERAKAIIDNRDFGIMCQFDTEGKSVKVGDKLDLIETKQVASKSLDKTAPESEQKLFLLYANKDKSTKLLMNCTLRGEIRERDFVENFYDVADFKDAEGKFASDTEKKLTHKEIATKTESFKILDAEKLNKIHVGQVQADGKEYAVVAGKLVEASQSIVNVATGRDKQSCAIIGSTVEELQDGMVFTRVGFKPGYEDISNNFAQMQIFYSIDDDNQIVFECVMRRNGIGPEVIFETFKGILQYGVNMPSPADDPALNPNNTVKRGM